MIESFKQTDSCTLILKSSAKMKEIFALLVITTVAVGGNPGIPADSKCIQPRPEDGASEIFCCDPKSKCCPYKYQESPSCEALSAHALTFVNPDIYGVPGIHYVVMASYNYMTRLAYALGEDCPADTRKWEAMQLQTPWTGPDSGDAYDIGHYVEIIRRHCSFPTDSFPFLCQGQPGTEGTKGESLGWLSYVPVLTDNKNWCLFINCWDPSRPDEAGTNYSRSWILFSKTKTLSGGDEAAVRDKVVALGFDKHQIFKTNFDNPSLNPIGAVP